ncbi:phosphomannomutase [Salmonella enterica subsp. enterica]|uniref:Phosphomannomutase n=1 Tax=Salmonella enterica I TaxID=59201 RepID=A0A379W6N3_SALET|nr:phosphomannomutase [Salmonella enterica subsp. enterica]
MRLTSEALKLALAKGLQDAGVNVLDIGMSGTEEIYFATFHLGVDGGIEVTASHNPMDYNGMKLVREGARPISGDTGLRDVQRLAEAGDFPPVNEAARGSYRQISLRDAYIDHLLGYISVNNLTPLKLVVNSGNGAAGRSLTPSKRVWRRWARRWSSSKSTTPGRHLPERHSQPVAAGVSRRHPQGRY